MRLLTRLLLSHTMPILVMGAALGVLLVSLVRMTVLLGEVREREMGALHVGEELHRAGWSIELAMRHGLAACEAGEAPASVGRALDARAGALERLLAQRATGVQEPMATVARGYVELARSVLASGDACAGLRAGDNQSRRWRLDEQLTDAWVASTSELHDAVALKDEEARRVGAAALSVGVLTALLALGLGVLVAQRLARVVTEPLGDLARVAHRVGEGDFSARAAVGGPLEVETLGREFDRMRARLAELDALKQGFLASVSHEMRTPLSKIREALALLAEGVGGPLTDRQRRLVEISRTACEREIRTVSSLLDLSRLRAGAPVRFQAGASVDEAVREAVAEHADEAREAGVELEVQLEGEAPRSVMDAAMVERAVANLVRNALGVSQRGQRVRVTREVRAGPGGRGGPFVVVTVRDEGPGVAPEVRETLFDAFVTRAVANSPKGLGVGLGLALAREVARVHGGELELVDEPGPGAAFRLWLPLLEGGRAPAPSRPASEVAA
jgi:two-component system sensor histidine kinase GlrK